MSTGHKGPTEHQVPSSKTLCCLERGLSFPGQNTFCILLSDSAPLTRIIRKCCTFNLSRRYLNVKDFMCACSSLFTDRQRNREKRKDSFSKIKNLCSSRSAAAAFELSQNYIHDSFQSSAPLREELSSGAPARMLIKPLSQDKVLSLPIFSDLCAVSVPEFLIGPQLRL